MSRADACVIGRLGDGEGEKKAVEVEVLDGEGCEGCEGCEAKTRNNVLCH